MDLGDHESRTLSGLVRGGGEWAGRRPVRRGLRRGVIPSRRSVFRRDDTRVADREGRRTEYLGRLEGTTSGVWEEDPGSWAHTD